MALVKCPQCQKILGAMACGTWTIAYSGREYVARQIKEIRCDRCHQRWEVVTSPNGDIVLCEPEDVA